MKLKGAFIAKRPSFFVRIVLKVEVHNEIVEVHRRNVDVHI